MNEEDYIACFFGFKQTVDREQYDQVINLITQEEDRIKDKISKISKSISYIRSQIRKRRIKTRN